MSSLSMEDNALPGTLTLLVCKQIKNPLIHLKDIIAKANN